MRNDDLSWGALCFFTGAAMGAVAGLLLAPQSGPRTRRLIRRKLNDGREYLEDVSDEIADRGREVYDRGRTAVEQKLQKVASG